MGRYHRSGSSSLHGRLLGAILLLLLLPLPATAAPLTFGIVPQQAASTLIRDWTPLLRLLSEQSGLALRFATAPTIPEFEARLQASEYDIAYMNPYHFTVFNDSPGYHALVHAADRQIRGIVVVRHDASIGALTDLEGGELVFPAPAAFAATLLTQATLRRDGINFTPRYVGSHDSVYLNVAKGLALAGGGVMRTYNMAPAAVREQLRVLYTTPGFTPHAIATAPRLPDASRQALLQALLALPETEAGRAALERINISAFQTATDSTWDDVRELGINRLLAQER